MRRHTAGITAIVMGCAATIATLLSATNANAVVAPAAGAYAPITAFNLFNSTIAAHGTAVVTVTGASGIPVGAAAVAMDVIVVSPPVSGFASVYPSGTTRPHTSVIDFTAHQRIADLVITKTGNNAVNVYNGSAGTATFVVNAIGYYAGGGAPVAGGLQPLTPVNVLDTGTGVGAPAGLVPAHGTVTLQLTGRGGIPASNVGAVVLDVAYVAPTRSGFGVVYPSDVGRPGTSNIDFIAPQTISNLVITKLSASGAVNLYNGSGGTVRIEANVFGYFAGGTPTAGGTLQSLTPANILDTGTGVGAPAGLVAAHATVTLQVTGRGGVPSTGVQGAVLNIAVVTPTAGGYATVYPSDQARPPAATLNFTPNRTIANLTIAQVSATGTVSLYNGSAGTVRFVANVLGYTILGA
ncbi:MAG TPA: hypothetical protein VGN35_10850 [Jatrophihabitantaceae bacterium]|jgi:hypothetical protein|nr:hypothetical protein [Jatrophihabitantaceae bacterium]